MTRPGMIVGSAGYMAPEQARGQVADKRADIWAFGVVLLEMLTRKQTFSGATVDERLEAVLTKDPDWDQLPAGTPVPIRRLLERCLQRDRKKRLQAIGDARIAIEEYLANPAAEVLAMRPSLLPWFAAAVFAVAALAGWLVYFRKAPPEGQVLRYSIPPHDKLAFVHIAPSPDGRLLAFVTQDPANKYQLWLRRLDSLTDQALAGTEGAILPFWSPDSRFLGFWADGKLKKIDVGAYPGPGLPETLCDAGCCGATWNRDGVIVFGSDALYRVSAAGGKASPLKSSGQSGRAAWPWFLPDGRHFLYTSVSSKPGESGIYVGSVESPERKQLLQDRSNAVYARTPAERGLLLFMREGNLMAQPFDATKLQLTGTPRSVIAKVRYGAWFTEGFYSVSENGLLAYLGGGLTQWTWFDRNGKRLTAVGEPANYGRWSSLSPDQKRLVVTRTDLTTGYDDIWLIDLPRGISSRFTYEAKTGPSWFPAWSPDGKRIFFSAKRDGVFDLYVKNVDEREKEKLLLKSDLNKWTCDLSRDGRFLLYTEQDAKGEPSLWLLPLGGDPKSIPFPKSESPEYLGVLSPDGKWVAYLSNEAGKWELHVRPSPQSEASLRSEHEAPRKWQISSGGADRPVWRRDGKELFFKSPESNIMAVALTTSPTLQPGVPRLLFAPPFSDYGPMSNFSVTADGQRFLILTPVDYESTPINVVVNWVRVLKP